MFGTPSGVVLSPQDPTLLEQASLDLQVEKGYVIANFDPALAVPAAFPGRISIGSAIETIG